MTYTFSVSTRVKTMALISVMALLPSLLSAQGYTFKDEVRLPATSVKNQGSSGTCWCFATASFMESELLRMNRGTYDLSEMFIVHQKYLNQLDDNYLRRGRGNIGEGSLSHTFKHAYSQVGIVPEEVYSGIHYASDHHDHQELSSYLGAVAGAAVNLKKRSPEYEKITHDILDTYLGKVPEKFTYQGKEYTPKSFAASLKLNMDDYVEISSFTHHPYYEAFDLEVPDNWEHERIYNLPLDEFIDAIDHALQSGYTVDWDGDVSEKGFLFGKGVLNESTYISN